MTFACWSEVRSLRTDAGWRGSLLSWESLFAIGYPDVYGNQQGNDD